APRARARFDGASEFRPTLHAHALERRHVVVERMSGQEEADGLKLLLQPLGRQPGFDFGQSESGARRGVAEREFEGTAFLGVTGALRLGQNRIDSREDPRTIVFDRVEGAGRGEALEHALVDGTRIDAASEGGALAGPTGA